jgi:cytochrome c oxidase subunit IV
MAHTAHADNNNAGKREIWKVTIILSVLTLIELALGYAMIGMKPGFWPTFLKGIIIILMMAKAFYIVAYFMHLGHELRNMIMTIVVPLGLFIWFIIAFLYDGNSYKILRNTYDAGYKERTTEKTNQGSTEGKHGVKDVKPQGKSSENPGSHGGGH